MTAFTPGPLPAWEATLLKAAAVSKKARMYAAAPELLEALRGLMIQSQDYGHDDVDFALAKEAARAALAQVEGGK